ncbi:alpha/beta hydrolase [Archangium sp.]|uniref:alpha/beta hydrolase n=1 Tax=Archangium sp. TaxID=1872627 RepID=UPI002D265D47|nr:alpha/beta fold hydrolase [Archangium sp.]HYO56857.1 alpha/beta fold hydrolase [Archangium sp.]
MRKTIRFFGVWMAMVLGVALALPGTAVAKGPQDVKVERREFPVQLSDGHIYTVVGYLYYQGSLKNRPVQILTHGITYNHGYWDLPEINGQEYSYARYMARRHYAVLALDLPGTGESDKPDGDFINLTESVSALHQVVQRLRATAEKNTFETLIYVGHSNGALISTFAQALYGDAQAMVNTGWLNTQHEVEVDPEDIQALLAQGPYIRLPEEMRGDLFYAPGYADPAVIAHDNEVADAVTRGQLIDLLTMLASPELIPTEAITVPVMVQLGDKDPLASSDDAEDEEQKYPNARFVWVDTLDNTGHVFNGHYSRMRSWMAIDAWLRLMLR